MNKFCCLMIWSLLCHAHFLLAASDANLSSAQIDDLLYQAEQNRLTDTTLFNENISRVESSSSKLNENQTCLHNYLKAYQLAYRGEFELMNSNLELYLDECNVLDVRARMYALSANTLVISGKFEQGLISLDAALKITESISENADVLTYVYSAAGIVYDSIDQPDLSEKYSDMVYQLKPTPQNSCKTKFYKFKQLVEDHSKIIPTHGVEETIKQCEVSKLPIQSLFLHFFYLKHKLDATYSNHYDLQNISQQLDELEKKVANTNYPNIQSFYWAMVAYTHEKLGDYSEADKAANLCLNLNKGFGDSEQKIIALEVKLQVALQKANDHEAYQLLKERTDSEQRRFNNKQAKLAAFMKVKHNNLAKTHQISVLNQKNKLLEMEQLIAQQNVENQRLLVSLLSVLLLFILFWLWYGYRRQIQLKKLSESDHLTQVLNRQGLEAEVSKTLAVADENNQTVHMAILDLDHFKKVNDNCGHLTGDWVLKHVIKACKDMLKDNMLMGRLGGEEFAIWLFDISVKDAKDFFDSMRQKVALLDCGESGHDINITASFGVANSVNSGYNITQLLKNADIALYKAKSSGRNQVVIYHHEFS